MIRIFLIALFSLGYAFAAEEVFSTGPVTIYVENKSGELEKTTDEFHFVTPAGIRIAREILALDVPDEQDEWLSFETELDGHFLTQPVKDRLSELPKAPDGQSWKMIHFFDASGVWQQAPRGLRKSFWSEAFHTDKKPLADPDAQAERVADPNLYYEGFLKNSGIRGLWETKFRDVPDSEFEKMSPSESGARLDFDLLPDRMKADLMIEMAGPQLSTHPKEYPSHSMPLPQTGWMPGWMSYWFTWHSDVGRLEMKLKTKFRGVKGPLLAYYKIVEFLDLFPHLPPRGLYSKENGFTVHTNYSVKENSENADLVAWLRKSTSLLHAFFGTLDPKAGGLHPAFHSFDIFPFPDFIRWEIHIKR